MRLKPSELRLRYARSTYVSVLLVPSSRLGFGTYFDGLFGTEHLLVFRKHPPRAGFAVSSIASRCAGAEVTSFQKDYCLRRPALLEAFGCEATRDLRASSVDLAQVSTHIEGGARSGCCLPRTPLPMITVSTHPGNRSFEP